MFLLKMGAECGFLGDENGVFQPSCHTRTVCKTNGSSISCLLDCIASISRLYDMIDVYT